MFLTILDRSKCSPPTQRLGNNNRSLKTDEHLLIFAASMLRSRINPNKRVQLALLHAGDRTSSDLLPILANPAAAQVASFNQVPQANTLRRRLARSRWGNDDSQTLGLEEDRFSCTEATAVLICEWTSPTNPVERTWLCRAVHFDR